MVFWKRDPVDGHLKTLATAETVAFGGVGIANAILPPTEAYRALRAEPDPALRVRLERMLDSATPAGRVYAAHLLEGIDPAAGRAAWHRLAGQPDDVSTFEGCLMRRTTLRSYASAHIDDDRR